jgi:very-short-patch-repair endonuclease
MNVRFLRQRPILNFIVDFFSPEIGLIIEIDGNSHINKGEYDFFRQNLLTENGFIILRFSEGEVINNLEDVNFKIQHAVNCLKEIKRESPPSLPPQGGKQSTQKN